MVHSLSQFRSWNRKRRRKSLELRKGECPSCGVTVGAFVGDVCPFCDRVRFGRSVSRGDIEQLIRRLNVFIRKAKG